MSPLGLILTLCVIFPAAATAQQGLADAPGRTRALLERLDASVRSPKDSYAGEARRPIAAILEELRAESAKLEPPPGQAEALAEFQRAVEQRLGPQDELWTGASLKLGSERLTTAFSRLFPAQTGAHASFSGPPPAVVRAVPDSAVAAANGGRAALSDQRQFYDGGAAGRGGAEPARSRRRFGYTGPAQTHPSDLALPPVPAPRSEESACREASGALGGLCGSKATAWSAPLAAGVGDAFVQQFGTVKGIVSMLAFTALGLLLSALSGGVGLLVTIVKALCGLAVLWMVGSLIMRLFSAFKDLATTKADDPKHWRAMREIGKIGGELLIVVLMSFAGYKIGQKAPVKEAVGSMNAALLGKMARFGVKPAPVPPKVGFGEPVPAAASAATAPKYALDPNKWNYFFGRVKAVIKKGMSKKEIEKQLHNEQRSQQIARVLEENGIKDNPTGRERMLALFDHAMSAPSIRTIETPRGASVIKPAEVPSATLEVSFYYPKDAKGVVDFSQTPIVSSLIPKEH